MSPTHRTEGRPSWVIAGPPAAGKTTATQAILERFPHLELFNVWRATQDLLRSADPAAESLRGLMKRRDVFPDNVVKDLFVAWVTQSRHRSGLLIDGYPKNVRQTSDLFEAASTLGLHVCGLTVFDVSDEVVAARAAQRLECPKCGVGGGLDPVACVACGGPVARRPDDDANILASRIAEYRNMIRTIEPKFSALAPVKRIDAARSRNEVLEALTATWAQSIERNCA